MDGAEQAREDARHRKDHEQHRRIGLKRRSRSRHGGTSATSRWQPVNDGSGRTLTRANQMPSSLIVSMKAKASAEVVSGSRGSRWGRKSRSATTPASVAAAPATTTSTSPMRPVRNPAGSMAIGRIHPAENTPASVPSTSRWTSGLGVSRPS